MVYKLDLPSHITFLTQLIEVSNELKGALREASVSLNDNPILAYLIAEQSLAPSPVIHTFNP